MMKFRRLAAVAVFSVASAGFSAPAFSAPPPPEGAFLRDDGNYWMHGPQHDYIVGPASAYSTPRTIDRRRAPPPPRREIVPVDRRGYTWAPGYWEWRHNRYQWVSGRWLQDRPGYYYRAPTWVERGDRWVLVQGGWERGSRGRDGGDRDRDGIPNRYDRDRDNDGVPNRHDDRPDNPRRN
jgi:hypothetical protein